MKRRHGKRGESEEERRSPRTWVIRMVLLLVLALLLWILVHVMLTCLLWSSPETVASARLWGV